MSYFIAPDTGARYDIFGTGGAQAAAAKLDMPFLGAVPLVMSIRETSDTGQPVVVSDYTGPEAEAFKAIAQKILVGTPSLGRQ